jgi:hypothetical protein
MVWEGDTMKPYTKKSNFFNERNKKYPIVSEKTNQKYEVTIYPYCKNDKRYIEGCVVELKKKWFLFSTGLINRLFDNDNGKISISHWSSDDVTKTTLDYNMINMTKLIVNLYEVKNKVSNNSVEQLNSDFGEFSKWDGVVQ